MLNWNGALRMGCCMLRCLVKLVVLRFAAKPIVLQGRPQPLMCFLFWSSGSSKNCIFQCSVVVHLWGCVESTHAYKLTTKNSCSQSHHSIEYLPFFASKKCGRVRNCRKGCKKFAEHSASRLCSWQSVHRRLGLGPRRASNLQLRPCFS
jgi:hypothetical protein